MTEVQQRPLSARATERILAAELLDAFRDHAQRFTEFTGRLGGRLVNDVLGVETCVFDANATPIQRQWYVAAGCLVIENLDDANLITVHAAGAGSQAPTSGIGVYRVKKDRSRVIALASRVVTFYGSANQAFSYQAFTAAPQPVVGG